MDAKSVRALSNALDYLNAAQIDYNDYRIENAVEEINRAVALETPLPTGKFDIYKWCSDDKLREVLNGVYYDQGKMIATDGHLLVVLTGIDYPENYEGKIRRRDGVFIGGRFPRYESVRPKDVNHTAQVDVKAVREALRSIKAIRKVEDKGQKGVCELGGSWFDVDLMAQFSTFLEYKNVTTIRTDNTDCYERPWIAEAEDGSWALIMPLVKGDKEDSDRKFYDCNQK